MEVNRYFSTKLAASVSGTLSFFITENSCLAPFTFDKDQHHIVLVDKTGSYFNPNLCCLFAGHKKTELGLFNFNQIDERL